MKALHMHRAFLGSVVMALAVGIMPTLTMASPCLTSSSTSIDRADRYSYDNRSRGSYDRNTFHRGMKNTYKRQARHRGNRNMNLCDQNQSDCTISCNTNIGIVRGSVYEDINKNGIKDVNESGVSGIMVTIVDAEDNTFTTYTDSNGVYIQPNVAIGEATVTVEDETLPTDAELTAGENPSFVMVIPAFDGNNTCGYADINGSVCGNHGFRGHGHRYGHRHGQRCINGDMNVTMGDCNNTCQYADINGSVCGNHGFRGYGHRYINSDMNITAGDCNNTCQYTDINGSTCAYHGLGGYRHRYINSDMNITAGDCNNTCQYTDINGSTCAYHGLGGYGHRYINGDMNVTMGDCNNTCQYADINGSVCGYHGFRGYGHRYGHRHRHRYGHRHGQRCVADRTICSYNCNIVYSEAGNDGYTFPAPTGTVCGIVYEDKNENTIQDTDEIGTSGIVINIVDSDGETDSVLTNDIGEYCFYNVAEGNATVELDYTTLPVDTYLTTGDTIKYIDVISSQINYVEEYRYITVSFSP